MMAELTTYIMLRYSFMKIIPHRYIYVCTLIRAFGEKAISGVRKSHRLNNHIK